mmetsp:Transcript_9018/g.19440  ORF Transcript_9018/g.19440 Transcript_9018/m.19440 type:complete len:532 (-) Transcript_9018:1426-3021(-)
MDLLHICHGRYSQQLLIALALQEPLDSAVLFHQVRITESVRKCFSHLLQEPHSQVQARFLVILLRKGKHLRRVGLNLVFKGSSILQDRLQQHLGVLESCATEFHFGCRTIQGQCQVVLVRCSPTSGGIEKANSHFQVQAGHAKGTGLGSLFASVETKRGNGKSFLLAGDQSAPHVHLGQNDKEFGIQLGRAQFAPKPSPNFQVKQFTLRFRNALVRSLLNAVVFKSVLVIGHPRCHPVLAHRQETAFGHVVQELFHARVIQHILQYLGVNRRSQTRAYLDDLFGLVRQLIHLIDHEITGVFQSNGDFHVFLGTQLPKSHDSATSLRIVIQHVTLLQPLDKLSHQKSIAIGLIQHQPCQSRQCRGISFVHVRWELQGLRQDGLHFIGTGEQGRQGEIGNVRHPRIFNLSQLDGQIGISLDGRIVHRSNQDQPRRTRHGTRAGQNIQRTGIGVMQIAQANDHGMFGVGNGPHKHSKGKDKALNGIVIARLFVFGSFAARSAAASQNISQRRNHADQDGLVIAIVAAIVLSQFA